jgi:hypothetical protein
MSRRSLSDYSVYEKCFILAAARGILSGAADRSYVDITRNCIIRFSIYAIVQLLAAALKSQTGEHALLLVRLCRCQRG